MSGKTEWIDSPKTAELEYLSWIIGVMILRVIRKR